MSARNYWSNAELVKDAIYQRKREKYWREQTAVSETHHHRNACCVWANNCDMRAQASEDVLVRRIEEQLRRAA